VLIVPNRTARERLGSRSTAGGIGSPALVTPSPVQPRDKDVALSMCEIDHLIL
jgi:hypothetical protein